MSENISTAVLGEFDPNCEIKGPVYQDACTHEPGSYIGSFKLRRLANLGKEEPVHNLYDLYDLYDLYVFNDGHGQNVCIRYGDEPSHYISPGTVLDLLIIASNKISSPTYRVAAQMIDRAMTCTWVMRQVPKPG